MITIFVYTASGCTIFNQENESKPGFFKQELGRVIVDLNPLHLSSEMRWVKSKLKRIGYKQPATHERVVDALSHGLKAKQHVCIEL